MMLQVLRNYTPISHTLEIISMLAELINSSFVLLDHIRAPGKLQQWALKRKMNE